MKTITATFTAMSVAALIALATPGVAGASTVTASKDGTVIFQGRSGTPATVSFRPLKKSPSGRSVWRVKVSDRTATTLFVKGNCKRVFSQKTAICTAGPSSRLWQFRVLLSNRDDRLHWVGFATIRNTRFRAWGGSGDDALTLPRAGDRLYGNAGNDKLTGGGGGRLFGDEGDDRLVGGLGIDRLDGQLGNDVINSADGVKDASILCGAGQDSLLRDALDVANAQFCENIATP